MRAEAARRIRRLRACCIAENATWIGSFRFRSNLPLHRNLHVARDRPLDIRQFVKKVFTSVKAAETAASGPETAGEPSEREELQK